MYFLYIITAFRTDVFRTLQNSVTYQMYTGFLSIKLEYRSFKPTPPPMHGLKSSTVIWLTTFLPLFCKSFNHDWKMWRKWWWWWR
jgi:hypothetical protein